MENIQFKFIDQIASIENYLDFYLKNKSRDCILFSEDGSKFKVHKELFGQTNFLREILSSNKNQCCGTVEIICPCSKDELSSLVNFLYDGEIHCKEESDSLKIIENLEKIFGFPRNLDLNYPNETFSTIANNIETMAIIEEAFEDIVDDPNYENEGNKGSKIKISCKCGIIRNLRKCHGHLGARLKKICLFFF